MVDMDMDFLRRALEIEERAYKNAKAAYDHHKEDPDSKITVAMKEIMDDEEEHVNLIKEMMERKGKRHSPKEE